MFQLLLSAESIGRHVHLGLVHMTFSIFHFQPSDLDFESAAHKLQETHPPDISSAFAFHLRPFRRQFRPKIDAERKLCWVAICKIRLKERRTTLSDESVDRLYFLHGIHNSGVARGA